MHEYETPVDEPAHDVLAAEEFGMPAPDPDLHHGPVKVPEDPAGIPEPHDVLAADEFPMPAARPPGGPAAALVRHADGGWRRGVLAGMAIGLLLTLWLARRRG